jgi:prolyl-tRNA synthetase
MSGITAERDFTPEWHDIHVAQEGDLCVNCNAGLSVRRVIEIGNIFKLGTKYSEPLKAYFLDENGNEKPIIMGSYGIGPARIAAAAIEQNHDKDGIIWPPGIAPFHMEILPLNLNDKKTVSVAEKIYNELSESGIDVLIDDREVRAGVKFKDADLIGIPTQVIIGEKNLKNGLVEVKDRKTRKSETIPIEDVAERLTTG